MKTKNIGGPLDWQKMYARSNPKTREEQISVVHQCQLNGYSLGQTALCAKLTVGEVKEILGLS